MLELEPNITNHLNVKQLETEAEYGVEKNKLGFPVTDIDINKYEKVDKETPITNEGAAPCLIIYVRNKRTGEIISGHFPETNHQRELQFARDTLIATESRHHADEKPETIEVFSKNDLKKLGPLFSNGYTQYLKFLSEIKVWSDTEPKAVEVYVFGQNFGLIDRTQKDLAETYTDNVLEHQQIIDDLTSIGVSQLSITDKRSPSYGQRDDTCYNPDTQTIYLFRKYR